MNSGDLEVLLTFDKETRKALWNDPLAEKAEIEFSEEEDGDGGIVSITIDFTGCETVKDSWQNLCHAASVAQHLVELLEKYGDKITYELDSYFD